jgi:hypothetical protein
LISGVNRIRKNISPELRLMLLLARKEAVANEHGILENPDISMAIQQVIDWDQFLNLTIQHRVYPLVYKSIMEAAASVPPRSGTA